MLHQFKQLFRRNKGFKWTGSILSVDQDPSIQMQTITLSKEQMDLIMAQIIENLESSNHKPIYQVEGDGKAEFLPEMSEEEVLEYERNEKLGWKNFKIPGLKK